MPESSPRNSLGALSPAATPLPTLPLTLPLTPPLAPSQTPLPTSTGRKHALSAPREPEVPRPHGFPIIAVLAPVIGSLLIWALTRSPFALVFALLGPLVAIASVADTRIQARRTARRESSRFDREVAATRLAVERLHSVERGILLRAAPGAIGLTARPMHDPERWRAPARQGVPLRLGLGSAPSTVDLEGRSVTPPSGDDPVHVTLEQLHDTASVLEGVPITVDARLGVGVCGPGALAQAVARGILAQLGDRLSPELTSFSPEDSVASGWIEHLPHRRAEPPVDGRGSALRWRCAEESGVVAVASRVEDLPADCRVVVQVASWRTAHLVRCPDDAGLGPLPVALVAELVSAEHANELGRFLAAAAVIRGVDPEAAEDGVELEFQSLPHPESASAARRSLACVFARAADGKEGVVVDLVAHGPHAVIGGTTGSGKSELLVSWVLAMARAHSPAAVNFLLVDFKGGATFTSIRSLPHVVGIVTDLDERTAHRAMVSLRAELRYRERVIAEAGQRSIDDPGVELPRLVIVVDEFAAMAADFPELHELFADLAARGRSLGLHLVLCTQRPAGAIRDVVLANATLRLSLRVNNRADSIAVIGTAQAAELRGDLPGRAWISLGGEAARLVRVARVAAEDVRQITAQADGADPEIRRPWCDDLGSSIPLTALDQIGDGIPFALVDLPEQQRQETGYYVPMRSGSLLVIGAQGSGKTELFATLGSAPGVEALSTDTDAAWDAVEGALGRVRAGIVGPRVVLADDLDALVGRFTEEYQPTFVDRLVELARGGSAVGLQLGFSVRRIPPALQTLAALCDERIILRLGSRQDHLMAGGTSAGFVADASPGAGEWRGRRIQVALRTVQQLESPGELSGETPAKSRVGRTPTAGEFELAGYPSVIIVTTRVAELTRRLRAINPPIGDVRLLTSTTSREGAHEVGAGFVGAGLVGADFVGAGLVGAGFVGAVEVVSAPSPTIIVGDPDGWQANRVLLGAARAGGLVVIDRCSVSEFRVISGGRSLPPPIRIGADHCWAIEPDGSVRRMRVPSA